MITMQSLSWNNMRWLPSFILRWWHCDSRCRWSAVCWAWTVFLTWGTGAGYLYRDPTEKNQQGRLKSKGKTWKNMFLIKCSWTKMSEYHFGVTNFETVMNGCVFFSNLAYLASFRIFAGWIFIYFPRTLFWCLKMGGRVQVISKSRNFSGTSSRKKMLRASSLWGFYITYLC